jgi:hypothetical protein
MSAVYAGRRKTNSAGDTRIIYGEFTKTPVNNAHLLKSPLCAKNTWGFIIFNGGHQQNTQFRREFKKNPFQRWWALKITHLHQKTPV